MVKETYVMILLYFNKTVEQELVVTNHFCFFLEVYHRSYFALILNKSVSPHQMVLVD